MVPVNKTPVNFDYRGIFATLSLNDQFELLKSIVKKGEFETLPTDILTVENTTLDETPKETILHMLARSYQCHLIPSNLLTEKTLQIQYKGYTDGKPWYGKRLVDIMTEKGYFNHIPKKNITEKLLESVNHNGQSLLHLLAQYKKFDEIPKERLNTENIRLKDKKGNTVLESLAENQITHVPGSLLLQEDLTKTAHSGDTILQSYIRKNKTHEIKRDFINKDTLLLENPSKVSGLMTAIAYGYYEYIPKELLTKENILKENLEEENCVDVAFKNLIQTDKKEDQNYYLKTCLALLKPLPSSYINTLEERLKKKYGVRWKESSDFLQSIVKKERLRRAKEKVTHLAKEEGSIDL